MNLYLHSDFHDWYDHEFASKFDPTAKPFSRLMTSGMKRSEMFKMFRALQIPTPRNGIVKNIVHGICKSYFEDYPAKCKREDLDALEIQNLLDVVVYIDETKHCGDGKEKVKISEAIAKYPNHYCSEYIPTYPGSGSIGYRYLQVGKRVWWLRFSSADWRSNYGETVEIEVLGEEMPQYHKQFCIPLFAIDFVHSVKGLLAIDLNIAPGIDPIKNLLSAKEVVELLSESIEHFMRQEYEKITPATTNSIIISK